MKQLDVKQEVKEAVLEERWKICEEKIDKVDGKVNLILDNHLPHLQKDITDLKVKMALYTGGIAVIVYLIDKISK